ncbi:hypothetical protein KEM52_006471 [Ascosphaera acerosa]|nr:hypothetical protein KEM52_006471 [Ascosphaera acerosa]
MGFFRAPAPFRYPSDASSTTTSTPPNGVLFLAASDGRGGSQGGIAAAISGATGATMMAGMPLGHVMLLVFEAVMEVVGVSLPGYILARMGHFDAEKQKFLANLNVMIFTPCLVFTKLASQLSAENISELAIIPIIFTLMTFSSWACGRVISRVFGFKRRQTNFVTAMSVFGNSNSLPISLVVSLSKTLSGLHWDRLPNDNDDEVAARGILYLLVFQQLGQLLRWSWGYRVLLAPKEYYDASSISKADSSGTDEPAGHVYSASLLGPPSKTSRKYVGEAASSHGSTYVADMADDEESQVGTGSSSSRGASPFPSGAQTPAVEQRASLSKYPDLLGTTMGSPPSSSPPSRPNTANETTPLLVAHPTAEFAAHRDSCGLIERFPSVVQAPPDALPSNLCHRVGDWVRGRIAYAGTRVPSPLSTIAAQARHSVRRILLGAWEFMNPPLWSMGIAILVASVPALQDLFFTPDTFVSNSITRAIDQTGSVAVPLILVVLGANLARNTLPDEQAEGEDSDYEHSREETNLVIASLLGRIVLPTIVTAPILALMARYLPISILDDPIFVVVCYLLAGAPPALQLAQICQINNVYLGAVSRLLFQSYVVWVLPSSMVLVTCALGAVRWAA